MGSSRLLTLLRRRGGVPYPARAPDTLFSFIAGTGEEDLNVNNSYATWKDQSGNKNDAVEYSAESGILPLPGTFPVNGSVGGYGLKLASSSLAVPWTLYVLWSKKYGGDLSSTLMRSADGAILAYRVSTSDRLNAGFNGPTILPEDDAWYAIRIIVNGASSRIAKHDGSTLTEDTGTSNQAFTDQVNQIIGRNLTSGPAEGKIGWVQLVNAAPADPDNDPIYDALVDRISLLPDYGSRVQIDATNHCAFGGCALDGTTIIGVYRRGLSHFNMPTQPGDLYISTATSPGTTWSAPALLFTDSVDSYDARDPRITVLSTGRWIVNFFLHQGGTTVLPHVIYSDNQGTTWSSKILVTNGFPTNNAGSSSPIVELANGDLLSALYAYGGLVRFSRSTDSGDTWTDEGVQFEDPPGGALNEPNIGLTDDGNVLCLIRCGDNNVYRAVGTYSVSDGSISWNTPVAVTTGSGAPGWRQASDGTIYLMNRSTSWLDGELPGCIKKSTDRGLTWSSETFPYPSFTTWAYGHPIQVPDGDIYLYYSNESSSGFAQLWWGELVE